jgi:hypothetical protein
LGVVTAGVAASHLKQQETEMPRTTKQATPIPPVEDPEEFFGLRSAHWHFACDGALLNGNILVFP